MIGKAAHIILKDKIPELSTGGIYPVVMPQNAAYSISASSNYPAIVYHNFTDYETSKDSNPNIIYGRLVLQVISTTYKSINEISTKVRDVLDHYVDRSQAGLVDVPSYKEGGNYHNFINNIQISQIFYQEEEDEYFDDLELYTRRIEYDVYYFDDIMKFSYDQKNNVHLSQDTGTTFFTPTNPLCIALDCTTNQLCRGRKGGVGGIDYSDTPSNGGDAEYVFNKLGKTKFIATNGLSQSLDTLTEYFQTVYVGTMSPDWYEGTSSTDYRGWLEFLGNKSTEVISTNSIVDKMCLPFGAMFIYVYRPTDDGGENYLSGGNNESAGIGPMLLSHKKVGSDITIHFNPNGSSFDGSSRERTLISSTNSTNYWDADIHFLCVSLGGSKNYTGGTYNQEGWFEYFNSDYNPKLTTGQILKNNQITGNTDNFSGGVEWDFTFSRIGSPYSGISSAGFNLHELLVFVPNEKKTHGIDADAAPFQPTDIIYRKAKEYIYNKYKSLK